MLGSMISLILYKDSKSLFNCLVKFKTIQEKQMIIDMMSLRPLYKQQEIIKVKWFHRHYNPANSITKAKPLSVFKTFINTNCIILGSIKYVKQTNINQANTGIKEFFLIMARVVT